MKFLFPLLFLLGCSEHGFVPNNGDNNGFAPDIEVSPAKLEYGTLSMGVTEVKSFTVTNVGTDELDVSGMVLNGGSFTLVDEELSYILPPDVRRPGNRRDLTGSQRKNKLNGFMFGFMFGPGFMMLHVYENLTH